jgi:hypothetical protein
MAKYIEYDGNGEIIRFGIRNRKRIKEERKEGKKVAEVDKLEKNMDQDFKLDGEPDKEGKAKVKLKGNNNG